MLPQDGRPPHPQGWIVYWRRGATLDVLTFAHSFSALTLFSKAAYSWWTVGPDQEVWGKPEDIYLKLKEGYDKAKIPIMGFEPDNNWIVTYAGGNNFGNGTGKDKNWKGRQWDYNTELYPSGGKGFVSKLGNLSMTYYTNGFTSQNAYVGKYDMTKQNEPHPNASYTMYSDLMRAAKSDYNMQGLFTDFLCYRGPAMAGYHDVPFGEDGEHMWLAGMTKAAQDLGIEVQYVKRHSNRV